MKKYRIYVGVGLRDRIMKHCGGSLPDHLSNNIFNFESVNTNVDSSTLRKKPLKQKDITIEILSKYITTYVEKYDDTSYINIKIQIT